MYKVYKNNPKVRFFFVYIREAHPVRKAKAGARGTEGIAVHKTIQSRALAAQRCMRGLKLTVPFLIDGIDNATQKAYRSRPAATAIVDIGGKIVYYTRGPRGINPRGAEKILKKLLPKQPRPPATQPATMATTREAGGPPGAGQRGEMEKGERRVLQIEN